MAKPAAHNTLDRSLFEQLFKAHFVHLCNFANQQVRDLDSAREITQKVFVNLWENREKVDPGRSLQSYLFTAVRNRCLNHIRDQKKYRSRVLDLEIVEEEFAFPLDDPDGAALRERVAAALQALPEKCRLVFTMSRQQDMKYREIAEELNISVKTVEAHMSKALKDLRAALQDYLHLWWWLFLYFLK